MIDHLFGRPSPSWKRTQVGPCNIPQVPPVLILVNRAGLPRHILLAMADPARDIWAPANPLAASNQQTLPYDPLVVLDYCGISHIKLADRFTPWQLIVSTLTGVYAVRNFDKILGLGGESSVFMGLWTRRLTNCD